MKYTHDYPTSMSWWWLLLAAVFGLMAAACGDDGALIHNEQNSEDRRSREPESQSGICHVFQSPTRVIVQCVDRTTICEARNNKLICEDLTAP